MAEEFGLHELAVEDAIVAHQRPAVSRRIYLLSREVIEFQRATTPLVAMLDKFIAGSEKYGMDDELQSYLRDAADHAITVVERVAGVLS